MKEWQKQCASASWGALFAFLVALQTVAVPGTGITSEIVLGSLFFAGVAWRYEKVISRRRLAAYVVAIATLSVCAFIASARGSAPSFLSLVLLIAIYWWFIIDVPNVRDTSRLRAFRAVVLVCAIAGILQFALQPVIGFHSFIDLLPEALRLDGFNTSNEVRYGAGLYRSNGFFFLEPSIFSQFMAIGILLEVLLFKRYGLPLLLMLIALVASVSGTGILLLVATGLIAAMQDRRQFRNLAAFGALGLGLLVVFAVVDFDGLQLLFLERAAEFLVPDSSGNARFVAPMIYVLHQWQDGVALLFGAGPGAAIGIALDLGLFADAPLLPKLLSEYGVIGSLPVLALIIMRLTGAHVAGWYKGMLFIFYWFLGGNLLAPLIVLTTLLLHASVPRPAGVESGVRIPSGGDI